MPTQNIYDLVDTWNAGGTTFTAVKMNVTDTASAAGSLLMDLQVGGSSKFNVNKTGTIVSTGAMYISGLITSGGLVTGSGFNTTSGIYSINSDAILSRRAAANLRLGAADAAAPVAQTLSVQSVVAGTSNTAGANLTITGSQGTGTGAGGSIIFQVAPAGSTGTAQNALATRLTLASNGFLSFATSNTGFREEFSGFLDIYGNGSIAIRVTQQQSQGVRFGSYPIVWGSDHFGGDVFLQRDAANTLALRNGANAQTFRVYNTTDGTNSEFGKIAWSSNVLQIGTEKAGTGTARVLHLQTDGVTRLTIDTSDNFVFGSTFTNKAFTFTNVGFLYGRGNGVFQITNSNETGFDRLQFGGTTSSFPAIKRSSTTLQARLADDSAFASVQGKLTTDTAYTAGAPTATGYLVLFDSNGTAYRVPAVLN